MTATSPLMRIGVMSTPVVIGLFGILAATDRPDVVGGWLALSLAAVLGLIAIFDSPLRSHAGPAGLTRRCPGRTHVIAWSDVVAIELGASSVTAVTTRNRRYLLAAGTSRWIEHPDVPDGVVVRNRRRRQTADSRPQTPDL